MPFALLLLGMLAFVSAYKNTLPQLGALLKSDFSGPANFLYWIVALVIIGSLGNFAPFRASSKMLLLLILVVMILANDKATGQSFFAKFVGALNAPAPATSAATVAAEGNGTASSGSGGILGTGVTVQQAAQAATVVAGG